MENNAVGRVANLINEELGDTLAEEEVADFRAQQEETVEFEDSTVVKDNVIQTYPSEEGVTTPEIIETETTEIKEDIIGVNTDAPIRDAATEFDRINDTSTDVPVKNEDKEVTNDIPKDDILVDTPPVIEDNTGDVIVVEDKTEVLEETKPVEEPIVIDDKSTTPEVIEDVATTNNEDVVTGKEGQIEDTNPVTEEPVVVEDNIIKEETLDDIELTETETVEEVEEVSLTEAQLKIHQLEAICSEQNVNTAGDSVNTPILTAALRILQGLYSDNKVVNDIDNFNLELLSNDENTAENIARLTFMIKGESITQILVNRYGKLLYVGGLLDNIKDGITKEAYDFDNAIRSITGVPSTEGLYEPYLYFSEGESGLRYFNISINNNYIEYKKVIEELTKEISKIDEVAEGVLPAVIINDQKEYDTLVFERTVNIINPATGFNEDAEFLITKEIKPLDKITGREVSLTIEKLEKTINDDRVVSNTYKSIVYHEFLVL